MKTSQTSKSYAHIGELISDVADGFAPPKRMSVSQAAGAYRYVNNPGSYVGPWDNKTAPYLVEPMDELGSKRYSGLAFCGPAQSGKTDALDINFIVYTVKVSPMDMIIYSPTNTAARDFSIRRVDRLHRHSPEVGSMLLRRPDADNKFDKQYSNGVLLSLSWPSVTELAGKPIPRVVITDYDRIPDDIDGDGSAFDLGSKRTTSFMSFGMTCAESSPSRDLTDTKWLRRTPHEAPPVKGILGLYNRGDRRRWYWPCPHCHEYFEGNFNMLTWDRTETNLLSAADTVRMVCPHCAKKIHQTRRNAMQLKGHWLKDGQKIDKHRRITGAEPRTRIASFWLNGVAATFTNWTKLVQIYLEADAEFQSNGSEEALKKFFNNDLGEPYTPRAVQSQRTPEDLMGRKEIFGTKDRPVVPENVRFLIATIDVQLNSFKVQVHGVLPGLPADLVVIDRFDVHLSANRKDRDDQRAWVKPGVYAEDWDLLIEQVLLKTYPLADDSGRTMQIKATACDSGGKAGVTSQAHAFFRRLRKQGYAPRFILVKGDPLPGAPRTRISYPDSSDGKNKAASQGDVPVLMLASNTLKDMLSNRLECVEPGKGLVSYADWLPDWFFSELVSETRTEKGWAKIGKSRNEAWDLLYYCLGVLSGPMIKIDVFNWDEPKPWARPWDENALVLLPGQRGVVTQQPATDWEALGRQMA